MLSTKEAQSIERKKQQEQTYQGTVSSGRGLGASLMRASGVLEPMQKFLGHPIVPGTLNLHHTRPSDVPLTNYLTFAELGMEYDFAQSGLEFNGAPGFYFSRVIIAGQYPGLVMRTNQVDLPPDRFELVSSHHLRSTLGLQDGDTIEFTLVDD